MEGGNPNY